MSDDKKIDFDSLYDRALADWPTDIDFGPLSQHGDKREISQDLYLLCDKITKPYLKSADEVLMRSLHDAIYSVLYSVSTSLERIKKKQIRKEAVQSEFEKRIGPDWIMEKYGWTDEDRKLVKRYFLETRRARAEHNQKRKTRRKKL